MMRDSFGDEITVYQDQFGVTLYCMAKSGGFTDMCLTPKQAKKLAKLLLKSAKTAKATAL